MWHRLYAAAGKDGLEKEYRLAIPIEKFHLSFQCPCRDDRLLFSFLLLFSLTYSPDLHNYHALLAN